MYDVIGDVHGCFEELYELLDKLGYVGHGTGLLPKGSTKDEIQDLVGCFWHHPEGRKLVFAGDLNDRGPDSGLVFNTVIDMVKIGTAFAVQGNHDNKLMRWLRSEIEGTPWKGKISHGLGGTISQLNERGDAYKRKIYKFLKSLPYKFEAEDLIVVHASYIGELEDKKREKDLALYGMVDKGAGYDEKGFPKRLMDWKSMYSGTKTIVTGHIVYPKPDLFVTKQDTRIWGVDQGCVFGGYLTAFRFPEQKLVLVKAKKVYHE